MLGMPPPVEASTSALPLHCVTEASFGAWRDAQTSEVRAWLEANAYQPDRNRWTLIPAGSGSAAGVVVGLGRSAPSSAHGWFWLAAALADRLPHASYELAPGTPVQPLPFALGWHYGGYRFHRYASPRSSTQPRAQLITPAGVDESYLIAATAACNWARDLVNTPANDMGPEQLEIEARGLATRHAGTIEVTTGVELRRDFPLIAAVGQGSVRAPRLIDLRFERAGAPRVTLVGKGVCFDTGGLDMKASAGMALMKKDMGGAAAALATAQLLRELGVPVDLRVIIAAVENSVDGNSFRPGDVWRSRKGLTVEITNTDAEGRLVLADALALASEQMPDLLIDFATLTGAARVALGPELPPVYGGDAALIQQLRTAGEPVADPMWPLPLWDPYDEDLSSRIADLNNAPSGGMAGSITAALFLRRFVADPSRWIHLDIYSWNQRDRPGRPPGGEAQSIRAVAALIAARCGK
jgi:leucyl aminopeptidase